ncbi:hypothetical protein CHARACLAT_029952 [Characodon lateralis]|uniref:Uncharacterized protein n=1 Tax=Characodon lateralis TaxID=208331 RepID=A0ABU7F963_9TELE|nr:hypothetical protein [Characodon lateralis]
MLKKKTERAPEVVFCMSRQPRRGSGFVGKKQLEKALVRYGGSFSAFSDFGHPLNDKCCSASLAITLPVSLKERTRETLPFERRVFPDYLLNGNLLVDLLALQIGMFSTPRFMV